TATRAKHARAEHARAGHGRAAAPWRPAWSALGPRNTVLASDFAPVSVLLATHLKTAAKAPRTKSVHAWVTGPGGWKRDLALKLWSGHSRTDGTWSNRLSLPPEAPAGNYSVGFLATNSRGQRAWRGSAASFSVSKTSHVPLDVSPTGPLQMTSSGREVVAKLFRPAHTSSAYATFTGPDGRILNAGFSLVSGNVDYGMWQATLQMPASAAPGTWRISTSYATAPGSVWNAGPATAVALRQTSAFTVTARPTRIRRGSPVVLSGRLTGRLPNGAYGGLARRRLQLMFRWNAGGAGPQRINGVTTDAKGRFRVSGYAARNGWMWLTWAGDPLYQAGTSRTFWITIK
ncbi:hypothetical protein DZF91_29045, partial [Actinomadura logoneensis]